MTPREVRAAIADSDFAPVAGSRRQARPVLAAAALLALGAAIGAGILQWLDHRGSSATLPAAAPPPAKTASAAPAPQAEAPKPPVQTAVAPAPPPPLLAAEQLRRLEGYGAGRNVLLRERLAATREKLAVEPDSSYSIELFLADNSEPERTERFLIRARDLVPLQDVYVIPIAAGSNAGTRYKLRVTYGTFASRNVAAEATKRLPPKYQNAFRFELRSWAELRAAI